MDFASMKLSLFFRVLFDLQAGFRVWGALGLRATNVFMLAQMLEYSRMTHDRLRDP